MNGRWRSPEALALARSRNTDDPAFAIRVRVVELLTASKWDGTLPVSPYSIAPLRGVRHIRRQRLPVDGMIERDGEGFVITINEYHVGARQRFTCAHEIMHTFFFELFPDRRSWQNDVIGSFSFRLEEEYLCDLGATELLMPAERFRQESAKLSVGIGPLMGLAKQFGVSVSAASWRLIELGIWDCAFVDWKVERDGDKSTTLRVRYSVSRGGIYIPRQAKARPGWGVIEAFEQAGGPVSVTHKIDLGSLRGVFAIESIRLEFLAGPGAERFHVVSIITKPGTQSA